MFDLSDEGMCERWVYDPYFQYFYGEEYFQFERPIARSSMTRWRNRLSPTPGNQNYTMSWDTTLAA